MEKHPTSTWLSKVALAMLIFYWACLVIGTHLPRGDDLIPPSVSDKFVHCTAYAILSVLILWNWSLRASLRWPQYLVVVGALGMFAIVDEVTQIPVGRDCDHLDWIADMMGTLGGLAVMIAATALLRASHQRLSGT
ncbi:MAG TPA: VanZ family protein [Pirellulales bacterium]|jgi:VanZ family protein|nr:VanZ family protein [Pirellulales bacterium]